MKYKKSSEQRKRKCASVRFEDYIYANLRRRRVGALLTEKLNKEFKKVGIGESARQVRVVTPVKDKKKEPKES